MKHKTHAPSKALAFLLALLLTLSLAVTSAGVVSVETLNPTDDPLLGTKFEVDAVISLVTGEDGQDISLTIPTTGVSKADLAAAVAAGSVELSLQSAGCGGHPPVRVAGH